MRRTFLLRGGSGVLVCLVLACRLAAQAPQEDDPDRFDDLERRMKKLEKLQADALEPAELPAGVLTLGGAKFYLQGKGEILFIDSESERDPIFGETEEPDPHLELERLRLEPEIDVGRGLLFRGQIDLKPSAGDTILKEMALHHDADLTSWLTSDLRIGLQDRFFRPSRPTKNYPLVGNAFWRDETLGIIWRLSLGNEDPGSSVAPPAAAPREPAASAPVPKAKTRKEKTGKTGKSAGGKAKAGTAAGQDSAAPPEQESAVLAEQESLVPAQSQGAASFLESLGRFDLYLSIGNGARLGTNEVGFDKADFNDMVQDDRSVTEDLALRELGVGLGYRRMGETFGELEVLGFYMNDRLTGGSRDFLLEELTLRDTVTGAALAGYGDSRSRLSERYGGTIEYFLPATTIWGASESFRRKDGLQLQAEWISGNDGRLRREGWSAHAAYRWSPPRRLFDYYFRSFEPIVRYSELRTNLGTSPLLAGTWDRKQILIGCLVEVTGNVMLDIEYTIHLEKTGGSSVGAPSSIDNNELLVDLVVTF